MKIKLENFLKIARLAHSASKEEHRYSMYGVFFDGVTLTGKATDGYRMATASLRSDEIEDKENAAGEIIIDRDACLEMLKVKSKDLTWMEVTLTKEKTILSGAGMSREWVNVDAKFPDVDQVWPKASPSVVVGLDADLLLTLAKSLRADGKRIVRLEIIDGISPIVVETDGNKGLLMPCRVDGITMPAKEKAHA